MRLKSIAMLFVRLLKPDKELLSDISDDLRKVGVTWIGGSLAGFLLRLDAEALSLFAIGLIIWVSGLGLASKAKAQSKEES